MTARPARALLVVPLIFASLAGCFGLGDKGHDTKAFDAIDVPEWRSGFSWTYDVTSSYHSTYAERGRPVTDSETRTDTFTMSVVNDTLDVSGEPVYMTRADKQLDQPFFQGTLQAVTKANLEIAAYGYSEHYSIARPVPAPGYPHSGYYPPQPRDPCEGVTALMPVDDGGRFPTFQFPLDDGHAWTGEWGDESDMPLFTYTARVRGIMPVDVPAGVFPSVYIETEFTPRIPEGLDRQSFPMSFSIRSESWYSPDVRYLTKSVVSAQMSGMDPDREGFGSASFDFVSTMQLKDFELIEKDDEPVEVVLRERYGSRDMAASSYPVSSYRIVADKSLPIELGQGPVQVQLGLEQISNRKPYDGRIETRDAVPQTVEIDRATHEVVWTVGRFGDYEWPWQEFVGDTLNLTLEKGGRYAIQSQIRPIKCGQEHRAYAEGELTTSVTSVYRVAMQPGLDRTVKVGEFRVEPELSNARIEWKTEPAYGTRIDKGHLMLTTPNGDRRQLHASPYQEVYLYPPGTWKLDWATDGPTVGDHVLVTVRTLYDPWHLG